MLFAMVCVAAISLVIGLKLRVPALIAATLVVIVASVAIGSFLQLSPQNIILSTLYLVAITQVAYFLGLALVVLMHRQGRER